MHFYFLQSIEVVPLFGDMNILPFSFVRQCRQPSQCGPGAQCKCYDANKWPLSNNECVSNFFCEKIQYF